MLRLADHLGLAAHCDASELQRPKFESATAMAQTWGIEGSLTLPRAGRFRFRSLCVSFALTREPLVDGALPRANEAACSDVVERASS